MVDDLAYYFLFTAYANQPSIFLFETEQIHDYLNNVQKTKLHQHVNIKYLQITIMDKLNNAESKNEMAYWPQIFASVIVSLIFFNHAALTGYATEALPQLKFI